MLSTKLARGGLLAPRLSSTCLPAVQTMATMKPLSPEAQASRGEFWAKNKALGRPMSPHLTIYKFQLTSMLSISHRISGLMQSAILSGFALGAVALPGSYPHYLSMVQQLGIGPVLIFSTKFVLAFPIVYHFWNGFRHLAWDMGHGFKIAELYKSGYFVVGLSFLCTLALCML